MILLLIAALFGIAVMVEIAAVFSGDWAAIVVFGIILVGLWHIYWLIFEQQMADEREEARKAFYKTEEDDDEDS